MCWAGKKNGLKMKYPKKLWPLRPATRAGRNATAIQTIATKIHHRIFVVASFSIQYRVLVLAARRQQQQLPLRYHRAQT